MATKHKDSCKMVFGRKDKTCPRCIEMLNGAPAVKWGPSRHEQDMQRCREIRMHNCQQSRCGVVCTFGEW